MIESLPNWTAPLWILHLVNHDRHSAETPTCSRPFRDSDELGNAVWNDGLGETALQ